MQVKESESILLDIYNIYPKLKTELDYSTPFQFLVAVILSAQTTDKQVNKVTS
jgi:endonuclease-3